MIFPARSFLHAILFAGCALVAACGGETKGGNSVQMKDMEVVDGTATDAMTDLDGVQSEGGASALPTGNASSNAADKAEPAPAANSEVLADQ